MSQATPMSFKDQLAFKPQGSNKNEYECVNNPSRSGNASNIVYGGYALATAAKAACLSVPPKYHLYSMLGNFLGPALADRPLRATVQTVRQTRTFATRQVEISQMHDNNKARVCLITTIDFQTKETASLFEYSKPPTMQYPHYSKLAPQSEAHQQMLADGKVTQAQLDAHNANFQNVISKLDIRSCPEGIFAQNLYGMAKSMPTTQDHLPITSRTTADWVRSAKPLESTADQVAFLAFLMDGSLGFAPLSFSHQWFDDISACSSLDFAMRVFGDVDLENWALMETMTREGSAGRTYGENWLWNDGGRAVACMNQIGIMRPAKGKEVKTRGKL